MLVIKNKVSEKCGRVNYMPNGDIQKLHNTVVTRQQKGKEKK